MRFVLALLAVGCSHHSSDSPEVVQAPKGDTMKSYAQQVNSAALTPVGSVDNLLTELLAVAPEGATWASVFSANVRFFEGVRETRAITQQHTAAASIGSRRTARRCGSACTTSTSLPARSRRSRLCPTSQRGPQPLACRLRRRSRCRPRASPTTAT
jgi:hypothetical protein